MTWHNTAHHYGAISLTLHWLMVFLVVFMFSLGWGREFVDGSLRLTFLTLHKSIGIFILCLAFIRLAWRFISPPPFYPSTLTAIEKSAATSVHTGLYIFLIALPLSGWAMVSFFGQILSFFGIFDLPSLFHKNRDLAFILKQGHGILAYFFAGIIGLHSGAALYHHLIKKDDILRRIIPFLYRQGL